MRPVLFRSILIAILVVSPTHADEEVSDGTLVFAGSNSAAAGQGIHAFRLQTSNLEVSQNITLVPIGLVAETPSATYFELDTRQRLLFTVNEVDEGTVSAFTIGAGGKLSLVQRAATLGKRPCHITLDKAGKTLIVVNCGSGDVVTIPVEPGGKLGQPSPIYKPEGVPAISAALDPGNRFVYICAGDKVVIYRFNGGAVSDPSVLTLKSGLGPRRVAFRPDGRFAYVLNGKASTLVTYGVDSQSGKLTETGAEAASTVPGYYDGPNVASEIGMHPTGRFVYVANQGHNSVVLFSVDAASGAATYLEEQGTGGKNAVHFGIQPNAQHLTIANRDSDTLLVARIDKDNGRLKPSGIFAAMPAPACVRFLPPPPGSKAK